jgi:hypothetical protein
MTLKPFTFFFEIPRIIDNGRENGTMPEKRGSL